MTPESYTKMRHNDEEWNCPTGCKRFDDGLEGKLDLMMATMNNKFKEVSTSIQEVVKSQTMISDQYDDIIRRLDGMVVMEEKVLKMEKRLIEKDEEFRCLDARIRHLEQYSRRPCIELREVLEKPGEDTEQVVLKVLSKLGVRVTSGDIDVTHRLRGVPGKTRAIIVRMMSRKKKDEIMKSKSSILTNQAVFGEGQGRIFISHSLSPYYRSLFMKTRAKAKECDYKYCWYELSTVPFPAPVRDVLIPRRLDTFRSGKFYSNVELFRDKASDLRQQTLKVITFPHVPATYKMPAPALSPDTTLEGTAPIGYGGLEIEVLNTLARIMNFQSEVYDVPGDEQWGKQQVNGSFSGLLGEIVSGRADMALGDLHYTPYHLDLMDLTIPYNTQCLTFLTPESLTDNAWQILILPFQDYLWAGVLISLVTGGIVFFALAQFHRAIEGDTPPLQNEELVGLYQFEAIDNSFLYTYSMLLLVSLPKLPAGWSLRVFTGWWWIYCILVVVAYRASMTAILANPVPRVTIDSLEQLAESRIPAAGWGEEIKKFFQTSLDAAGKKVGSKFEVVYDAEEAVERVSKGELAYYENIYFLKYISIRRQLLNMEAIIKAMEQPHQDMHIQPFERTLHIMRDCVINMPISLGLQKNSPLKLRVDRYLRLIIEAGLVKKWLNDAMTQVLTADRGKDDDTPKALMTLKKLYGAFVALGAGYGVSTLILLIENIYWYFRMVRNPMYDRYSKSIVKAKKIAGK